MLDFVTAFNTVLAVLFFVCYSYQLIYFLLGLPRFNRSARPLPGTTPLRYAAIVSARNEANGIGGLIDSLKAQHYPAGLLDIYVVADNCTDSTAQVARAHGAFVYERFNTVQVGKGYAMDELFRRMALEGVDHYDAYLVFDADNYVDPNFVAEMDLTFRTGKYDAITCYRNSTNFGENWISAGYGLWFLREARFLNGPRTRLGTSCHVSGTGFLVSAQTIRENGGWPFHLLTEDIEFSVSCAIQGRRIGYCPRAVVYDEQPVTFRQSWNQRLRWSKGFYQVDARYGLPLLRGIFRGRFSCYDMLATVAPGMLLTIAGICFNLIILLACLGEPPYLARLVIEETVGFIASAGFNFYLGLFFFGLATTCAEGRQIRMPARKKLFYLFTFPVFMFTYVPISLAALVQHVEWKPICHGVARRDLPMKNT